MSVLSQSNKTENTQTYIYLLNAMKRFWIALLVILQLFSCIQHSQAQTVEKLRLKRAYRYDNLDNIINAIGRDLDIRFIYDKEHLHRYKRSAINCP